MLIYHHYLARLFTIIFVFRRTIINSFFKVLIKTWLKSICTSIDISNLQFVLNKEYFGKVDEIYLEANNLIYLDIYINKIIIKIYNCNLKFNYRNHLIYSEDLIIRSFLTIDGRSLENTFFSKKWETLRMNIESALTGGQVISNIEINKGLMIFSHDLKKLNKKSFISLNLKENLIYLMDINNNHEIFLPLDKNIKLNDCKIIDKLINVDLSSKVIFDN